MKIITYNSCYAKIVLARFIGLFRASRIHRFAASPFMARSDGDFFAEGRFNVLFFRFSFRFFTAQAFLKDIKTPFVILLSLNHAINALVSTQV